MGSVILKNIFRFAFRRWDKIPNDELKGYSIYIFLVSPENNIVQVFDPARDTEQYIIQQINSCLKS